MIVSFTSPLAVFEGKGTWYYVTLPVVIAEKVKAEIKYTKNGWGSFKVLAKIGESEWLTSIFPHKTTQSFLLLVKAEVRKKAGLSLHDSVSVSLNFNVGAVKETLKTTFKDDFIAIDEASFEKIKASLV